MSRIKNIIRPIIRHIPSSNIYMFHHLSGNPKIDVSGCKLDTDDFYKFIEEHSNAIAIPELLKGRFPNAGKFAYTFDDGIEDVFTIAYPYLKKRNLPFTIFILTEMLDKPGYITTEQLLTMSKDTLITIGAHGTNHGILTQLSREEQTDEIYYGKKKLEAIIGRKVSFFAYSHGQYNKAIIKMVHKAGFKYAFSVRGIGLNFISRMQCYELPRCNVDNTTLYRYKK